MDETYGERMFRAGDENTRTCWVIRHPEYGYWTGCLDYVGVGADAVRSCFTPHPWPSHFAARRVRPDDIASWSPRRTPADLVAALNECAAVEVPAQFVEGYGDGGLCGQFLTPQAGS